MICGVAFDSAVAIWGCRLLLALVDRNSPCAESSPRWREVGPIGVLRRHDLSMCGESALVVRAGHKCTLRRIRRHCRRVDGRRWRRVDGRHECFCRRPIPEGLCQGYYTSQNFGIILQLTTWVIIQGLAISTFPSERNSEVDHGHKWEVRHRRLRQGLEQVRTCKEWTRQSRQSRRSR